MSGQIQVRKPAPATTATEEKLEKADTAKRDALLDEIDEALRGLDETLAASYVQKGGQ